MLKTSMGFACFVGITVTTMTVFAQEAQPAATPGDTGGEAVASGFMLQARMQTQANLLSIGGGSSFLLGYRGPSYGLGLGFGLTRVGGSVEDQKASATLVHVMPTALIDVWQSTDGRARANIIAGVGYGRGSVKTEYDYEDCEYDPSLGDVCTTETSEAKASTSFVPLMFGLGGDYFLSRNFALGAEAGLQGAFVFGVKGESDGHSEDYDASGNMQLAYGVIRATLVLGK